MYKEIEKYKTGKVIENKLSILDNYGTITIKENEYKAPFGDIINDLIEHKQKPFWRRKYYHNHLTELYLKFLNQVSFVHNF